MRDSTIVLLQFTQPKIPEEVRVEYLQLQSLSLYAALNATDTCMWLITVMAKKDAQLWRCSQLEEM